MKRILIGLLLALIVCGAAWSYRIGGIMNMLLDPQIDSTTRLVQIQDYFRS